MNVWSEFEAAGLEVLQSEAVKQRLDRDAVAQGMFLVAAARNQTATPSLPDLDIFDDRRLRELAAAVADGPRYYEPARAEPIR
jgi:hypothetical protein